MSQRKQKQKFNIWSLVCLNFVLRIIYVFVFTTPDQYIVTDMGAYNERALNLIAGNPRPFPNYWAPFFHIFLAAIYWPLDKLGMMDYKIRIAVLIMAGIGCFTVFFVYKIADKLFGEKSAKIAAILTTLWFPFIYLNAFLLSENLFIPLLYFGLYIYFCQTEKKYSDLALGLVWGMAVITRPLLLIFIGLFILWIIYKKRYMYALGFCTAFGIVLLNMSVLNRVVTNRTTNLISSGNGMNFTMQWCNAKSIEYDDGNIKYGFAPPTNHNYSEDQRIFTHEPFYKESFYYKMGLECVKAHPKRILTSTRSIKNLFDSELFPYFYNMFAARELYSPFKLLTFLFFIFSIFSVFKTRKVLFKKEIILLPIMILSLFVSVYIFNPGEERYLIPFAPILIMLFSYIIPLVPYKLILEKFSKNVR